MSQRTVERTILLKRDPLQRLIVLVPHEGREGALALAVLALVLLVVLQRWNRAFSLKTVRFVEPLRCWALQVPQRRRRRHTAYLITLLPYYPTALIPSCPIAGKPSLLRLTVG